MYGRGRRVGRGGSDSLLYASNAAATCKGERERHIYIYTQGVALD